MAVQEQSAVVAEDLVLRCTRLGLTVATAESLTAGLLAATVASVPGASLVLRGGLVVYATDLKQSLAGVDPGLLAQRGPVDPDVAGQLAEGAATQCGADVGVGVTGVAGPDPQDGHPVGEVWIAVWSRVLDDGVPRVTALDGQWRKDAGRASSRELRSAVRWYTVLRALEALVQAVGDIDGRS
ncbi:MAG: CinA family protein [Corynebacterium provencense]|jgi:nicotinamide-nucleotide amidase|uniref:CinA family protein n=1 Tax=Corynebacterium provencense TaxID=1737425 RepID=UPI002989CC19|nr:CinA family protein [Corynebacterium provencense]